MKMLKKWAVSTSFVLMLAGLIPGSASAIPLELALVLDGSGSIDAVEYQTQLNGYKNAFASGNFYDNYVAPSGNSLFVRAYQFSSTVIAETAWWEIDSNAAANTFGNLFNTTVMTQLDALTNTALAINTAVSGFSDNAVDGRLVIDISTDGNPCCSSNSVSAALAAGDAARSQGVTVNALGIGNGVDQTFLTNLVAPTGFFLMANTFNDFGSVLQTKLSREINDVPEPATLVLMGLGLVGIGAMRRRRTYS